MKKKRVETFRNIRYVASPDRNIQKNRVSCTTRLARSRSPIIHVGVIHVCMDVYISTIYVLYMYILHAYQFQQYRSYYKRVHYNASVD